MAELITTENLYLRQFTADDVTQEYIDALNDPEVVRLTEARHYKWARPGVIEYTRKSNVAGESLLLGVFLAADDRHIGNTRFSGFSKAHHRADLGIMIFDKAYWGRGYGTEALAGAVDYAFNELKLHKVCADYYSLNQASARIFAKAGFVVQGVFKDHFFLDGAYVDSIRVARINDRRGGS